MSARLCPITLTLPVLLTVLMTITGCALFDQEPSALFTYTPSSGALTGSRVTLNASPSGDPQGYSLEYTWTLAGPPDSTAALDETDLIAATFTPDVAGTYTVNLQVKAVSSSRKSSQTSEDIIVTAAAEPEATPSDARALTAFGLLSPAVTGTIDESAHTVAVSVPLGTDVNALVATFTTTGSSVRIGTTAQVSGTTVNNFTNSVTYTVVAGDASTRDYVVTVTLGPSAAKELTEFGLVSPAVIGTIDETAHTVGVTVPYGTSVSNLRATFATTGSSVKIGTTVQVSGTTANNFTSAVTYKVVAADATSQDYVVTVTPSPSPAKVLTTFAIVSPAASGAIDQSAHTVAVALPSGTSVTNLAATFTTTGATVKVGTTAQVSGTTANNFTSPVTYTVVAADATTQNYIVTVTVSQATMRTFRAQKVTDNTWYDVPSTLEASSDHSLVYVQTGAGVSVSTANAIASEFEAHIYGVMQADFGAECDVDANGKVILLLLDIVDGFSGSGGYVAGYFDPTHEFAKSTYANSNEADMLFLDTYPAVPGSSSFYGTVAHELQHMINFAATYLVDGTSQEIWINEGLSSGAECIYAGAQVQSRINYFNADPSGTIANGNNFFVWNGYWENNPPYDVLADYATVYLFFQWLRIHSANGVGIYKDILQSPYRDYRTVTSAASSGISSSYSSWETLLRTWQLANLFCASTGDFGYLGQVSVSAKYFSSTGGSECILSPGEGIFAQTTGGTYTPAGGSGSSIRYVGITVSTGALDLTSSYLGDLVLTYNTNSSTAGADEIGYLAGIMSGSYSWTALRSVWLSEPLPLSYPINLSMKAGGGLDPQSHRPENVRTFGGRNVYAGRGVR